jgi:outer membrane protein assembly factor BamA
MHRISYCLVLILCSYIVSAQQSPAIDTLPSPPTPRKFLALPFAVRSLETNWGFGAIAARFFKPDPHDSTVRTSDVNLLGLYTVRQQLVVVLSSTIFLPKEDRIARFQASYSYFPDKFWGLGNHSQWSQEEDFKEKQYFINPQFLQRIHRKLYVGITYEFQHSGPIIYAPEGIFDKDNIIGRKGGNTSGVGPILSWDTRNNAYSPTKGVFAEIQYLWYDPRLGSDFKLHLFNLDFRKFFYLSNNAVFAVQAISGLSGGNTPFRKLQELGGSDMMRGYYQGRYTDKCLMAYQAEYRKPLFWRFGAVIFVSTGEVSPDIQHFDLNGLHYAYGGGIRFMLSTEEKLNVRIDYGIAPRSSAFNVQLREAF